LKLIMTRPDLVSYVSIVSNKGNLIIIEKRRLFTSEWDQIVFVEPIVLYHSSPESGELQTKLRWLEKEDLISPAWQVRAHV